MTTFKPFKKSSWGLAALILASPLRASVTDSDYIFHALANGTAIDSSPLHNDGTFSGNYVAGRPGADLAFALGTGAAVFPDNPAYNLQAYASWTVGFWFNTDGNQLGGGNGVFLGQDVGAGENPKWFIDYGYGHPGAFEIHLNNYGSNPRVFLPSDQVAIPAGWNQFTLVRQSDEFDFYFNGDLIGVEPYGGIIPDPAMPLVLGQQEALGYYDRMDDVFILNRAATPQEIEEIANDQPVVPEANTLLAASLLALLAANRVRRSQSPGK